MDLSRYLDKKHVKIGLDVLAEAVMKAKVEKETEPDWEDDELPPEDDSQQVSQTGIFVPKEDILAEMVDLIADSPTIKNRNRLLKVIIDRELKTSTGIGSGVAIPHGRTHEVRDFIMGLAIVPEGIDFDALDRKPVNLIFIMASPPDNDALYLKILTNLTMMVRNPDLREQLINVSSVNEAYYILKSQV